MDPLKTSPFELGDGPDACLVIHGFTGTPWDVKPLGESLAARGFYVRGIRLPGHGVTPESMADVTYRDWEQSAEEALHGLERFRNVFVCGLSMGALLSVLLAARFPKRVRGAVFMAPAMRFLDRQMAAIRFLRGLPLVEMFKPWVLKDTTDIEDPVVRAQAPVLPAFPTARLADLWAVQGRAREAMGYVACPSLIAYARKDHVVSKRGALELHKGLARAASVRMLELREGAHIIPRDRGAATLFREVGAFLDGIRAGG